MEGIAFDLEGTCVDLESLHFHAYERALTDLGFNICAEDIAMIPGAIGGGGSFVFKGLATKHSALSESRLRERKTFHYKILFEAAQLSPRNGLIEFITETLSRGSRLSIGSTTTRVFGESILQKSGLDMYFPSDMCVFREDVIDIKPSPEVYLRTAALMDIPPSTQLVFEDSVVGVTAARDAGSIVIAVPAPFARTTHRITELVATGAMAGYEEWTQVPRQFTPHRHNETA